MPSTNDLILRSAEGASRRAQLYRCGGPFRSPSPSDPRVRGLYPTSVRVFGGRAIAADPWVGPVGDLALVLGQMRAPGVSLDRLLGLPDYVELTVRPALP